MRLIEFSLDLPYVENEESIASIMKNSGCDRNEATRQDYESNWKWKRRKFSNQTGCMSMLFSRCFGYIDTKDTRKIIVECVPKTSGKITKTFPDGFCEVQVQFDHDSFVSHDALDKKTIAIETLMEGIRAVSAEKNWDIEPFEKTYAKIMEAEYKNEWIWKKPVKSPDKKSVAHVLVQHVVESIDVSIVICDKRGEEIVRERVISEMPDERVFWENLGNVLWTDNQKVTLVNKNQEAKWSVCLF